MTTSRDSFLVGYTIDPASTNRASLSGTALIDGDHVEHTLTFLTQPDEAVDVGRNTDGDLMWISLGNEESTFVDTFPTLFAQLDRFDPVRSDDAVEEESEMDKKQLVHLLAERFSSRKSLVIAAGLLGAVLVFVGLGVTSGKSHNVPSAIEHSAGKQDVINETSSAPNEPTQAAIEFVMTGQVSGVMIPEGATQEDIHATVVSTSGDVVLVDVQAVHNEGLTTFATLLLQKSGTAWRIREVFDPR